MYTWLTRLNVVFRGSGASLSVLANMLHGVRSGIYTRFGCATASCTCSEKPLSWGFSGILSILKLVRFLQLRFPSENTRQFYSRLSSAVLCEEVVEWLFQNTVETGDYPLE